MKWAKHGDALAAWVADMDFDPPEVVTEALREIIDAGDLGYRFVAEPDEVFSDWQMSQHGWCPDPRRTKVFTTALHALETVLWNTTDPGDGVVVFMPIYHPFLHAIRDSGRRRVEVALDPFEWRLDVERLEAAIDDTTRLVLFCNPHNPTGRVFDREEIAAVAEVAERHDLLVVSDEIWGDLAFDKPHVPAALADERFAGRLVTISAASKSFNLAGLRCAVAHLDHPPFEDRLASMPGHILGGPSSLGRTATVAAWQHGKPWLDAACTEIRARRDLLAERLANEVPEVGFAAPEGTYLGYLDLRRTGLGDDPAKRLLTEHRLALSPGHQFGDQGVGWARINFATTEEILDLVVDRLVGAVSAAPGPDQPS